jgi:muramidase (phage lysozyme)
VEPNQKAFLDMIAISELGEGLIQNSDNGYNVVVGSVAHWPILFLSYKDHPRILNRRFNSTAAGRYQLLEKNFDSYKTFLKLLDFGPAAQDAIALQQIKECHAIDNIVAGNLRIAIAECSHIWASLPGNNYGQPKNTYEFLAETFKNAGGTIASEAVT